MKEKDHEDNEDVPVVSVYTLEQEAALLKLETDFRKELPPRTTKYWKDVATFREAIQ